MKFPSYHLICYTKFSGWIIRNSAGVLLHFRYSEAVQPEPGRLLHVHGGMGQPRGRTQLRHPRLSLCVSTLVILFSRICLKGRHGQDRNVCTSGWVRKACRYVRCVRTIVVASFSATSRRRWSG